MNTEQHFIDLTETRNTAYRVTLGQLAPEASHAIVQWRYEADLMPSLSESLTIFKSIPANWYEVPVVEFAKAVMLNAEITANHKSFDDYHQWYIDQGDVPTYPLEKRWPCILSSSNDEVLHDGWHRLHAYVRAGHTTIPVLAHDHAAWWQAHAVWYGQQHGNGVDSGMSMQP